MRLRLTRIGVLKLATVVTVMTVLLLAIILIPIGLIMALLGVEDRRGTPVGLVVLGAGTIGLLVYGVFIWIFSLVQYALLNLALRWFKGVDIDLETDGGGPLPPGWQPPGWQPPGWQPPPGQPPSGYPSSGYPPPPPTSPGSTDR